MMNFAFKMMNCVSIMMNFVFNPKIAGVSPYLDAGSLPKTWPQLYKKKGSKSTEIRDGAILY